MAIERLLMNLVLVFKTGFSAFRVTGTGFLVTCSEIPVCKLGVNFNPHRS